MCPRAHNLLACIPQFTILRWCICCSLISTRAPAVSAANSSARNCALPRARTRSANGRCCRPGIHIENSPATSHSPAPRARMQAAWVLCSAKARLLSALFRSGTLLRNEAGLSQSCASADGLWTAMELFSRSNNPRKRNRRRHSACRQEAARMPDSSCLPMGLASGLTAELNALSLAWIIVLKGWPPFFPVPCQSPTQWLCWNDCTIEGSPRAERARGAVWTGSIPSWVHGSALRPEPG
jgi:hypothetical protein